MLENDFFSGDYTEVASFIYNGDTEISELINCVYIKDNTYEATFNLEDDLTITNFTALNGYNVTTKSVGSGTLTKTTSS